MSVDLWYSVFLCIHHLNVSIICYCSLTMLYSKWGSVNSSGLILLLVSVGVSLCS